MLLPEDLNFVQFHINIYSGKGRKQRVIPMSPALAKTLYRFVQRRSIPANNPIFGSKTSRTPRSKLKSPTIKSLYARMSSSNVVRDLAILCEHLKIRGALMQLDFIDHFAISVKNLQTSFDWYQKTFGFEMFHQWKTTWLIQLGKMKIGLFERPQAATIDDLNNTIAFQHAAFHVSAEEFIQAEIQLGDLGVQFDGPEDTGVPYSLFVMTRTDVCSN